jgi:hypothetical protein
MAQPWTPDQVRQIINRDKDPTPPKRRKVFPGESKAYIRVPTDLIARRGLYNALKPYRERYTWWQYQFLCHLVLSSTHDIALHGDLPGVPIPWNALTKSLPSMTRDDLEELMQDGLMTRDYYDQADHKCYWYFMGEQLAEQVYHAYYARALLDILPEGVCSLVTGRSQSPLQTILYTNGKHEPSLIRQSFGMIRQNCVNIWKLHDAFEQLKADITTCTNPHQRQKFVYRYIGNQHCLDALMRQGLTIDKDTGIGTYVPAYQPSKTGRMFEIGGGCQALSRAFKQAAYDLPGLHNYDIRSSQVTALLEIGGKYGLDTHSTETLREYVDNKQAKFQYAAQAGMDVDLWKQCLLSLFFGASTEKVIQVSSEDAITGSIYAEMVDWCQKNDTAADPDTLFAHFLTVAQPFIDVRDSWLRIIQRQILPEETYRRRGKQYLENAVGKTMTIPKKVTQQVLREVSAFLLQGLEAAFIYTLITLSDTYGYEVRSCEHDGLITWGTIPQEAVEMSMVKSGFSTAILEDKVL